MKIVLFIIFFLLLGAFFIISEKNLFLKNPEARKELAVSYFTWIKQLFDNSKNLAGYVIKFDWLPNPKEEK